MSISFCIASAKNEKEYTKLLLKSLQDNTEINNHEIIIFIDSDNQNTYEELISYKSNHKNIRIYRNTDKFPIGSQRNVSLMFDAASNNTVCYLQSDMVVGKNFDKHILAMMDKYSRSIVSCARIEPPLHPPSPDKILHDCGVDPDNFDYEKFNNLVTEIQSQNLPDTKYYFAPFATTKNVWFDVLGGFDTQFRCSREDSDLQLRCNIANIELIQSWQAIVYHFTCVSSRGKDWFKSDKKSIQQNVLQQYADNQELKRFIRKWGMFGHHQKPIYDIGIYVNIDKFVDFPLLEWLETFCKVLYLNDYDVFNELNRRVLFNTEYYSNLRWGYSTQHWQKVKHLFNPEAIINHIQYAKEFSSLHDVNIYVNYSEFADEFNLNRQQFIENINQHIHSYPVGKKEIRPFIFDIIRKNDLSSSYVKVKNTQLLLEDNKFVFE